jgi:hypothetical protein
LPVLWNLHSGLSIVIGGVSASSNETLSNGASKDVSVLRYLSSQCCKRRLLRITKYQAVSTGGNGCGNGFWGYSMTAMVLRQAVTLGAYLESKGAQIQIITYQPAERQEYD